MHSFPNSNKPAFPQELAQLIELEAEAVGQRAAEAARAEMICQTKIALGRGEGPAQIAADLGLN